MEKKTKIVSTRRQILGAAIGMIVAGAAYFIIDSLSSAPLTGLLVDTPTISDNAHQVRVNDREIDDSALRRIAGNARTIASAQKEARGEEESPLIVRAESRREQRMQRFFADGTPMHAAAPTQGELHTDVPQNIEEFFSDNSQAAPVAITTASADALPQSGVGALSLALLSMVGAGLLRKRRAL